VEDQDGDQEDPVGGKLSEDHQPGWVISTISKMVQYGMEFVLQKQMKLDALTQPGRGVPADYFREMDKKYCTTALKFPAVVQPQTADDAQSTGPTTFCQSRGTVDNVPGNLPMPLVSSRAGSGHMRVGSRKRADS